VRELGGGDFDPPVVDHAAPPCLDAPSQLSQVGVRRLADAVAPAAIKSALPRVRSPLLVSYRC